MRKNSGFTLIELVIVIVLLAVLSAVALPKFINLKGDSKQAVLEGVGAAMSSGLELVHSKAVIENQLAFRNEAAGIEPFITLGTIDIPLHNGYPAVDGTDSFEDVNAQIKAWIDIDIVDRDTMDGDADKDIATFFSDKASNDNQLYIFFGKDFPSKNVTFKCAVVYTNDPDDTNQAPVVQIKTDEC